MHCKMVEGERESIEVFRNAKNYRFPVKPTVSVRLFFFSWSSRRKRKRTKKRSAIREFRALRSAT